jgi:hypothetical protein
MVLTEELAGDYCALDPAFNEFCEHYAAELYIDMDTFPDWQNANYDRLSLLYVNRSNIRPKFTAFCKRIRKNEH